MSRRNSGFRDGDWVRVTLEGRYQSRAGCGFGDHYVRLDTAGPRAHFDPEYAIIQTAVDPLPTTPGSVIRHLSYGYYRMLDNDGVWFGRPLDSAPLATELHERDYEVVYDAGAS